ncbi:TRADD-N-associated membrane domain-containing protein [Coleofasciculus sp. E1-EBD-02]|uniref:TRADD-N-associated membrane domain-containing protein n=1 Tax=Coleofasciculus sp. E1-EBD-02 TaxID=3068481 RepID=UPI0032F0F676
MNDNLTPNSDSTLELIIAQERLRQARQSFNLALMTSTTCILISFAGVGLVFLGKANEGTITATGGLASTGYCLKLSKDANDRLDQLNGRVR